VLDVLLLRWWRHCARVVSAKRVCGVARCWRSAHHSCRRRACAGRAVGGTPRLQS
jgi:hypothetical protein